MNSLGSIDTNGSSVLPPAPVVTQSVRPTADVPEVARPQDSANASGPAQLLSKLKDLQQTDPAKFKEVTASISANLAKDATAATDPRAQKFLTDLSDRFKTASATGDLSAVRPPPNPDTIRAKFVTRFYTDPADADTNGTVSLKEREGYVVEEHSKVKEQNSVAHRAYSRQARALDDRQSTQVAARITSLLPPAASPGDA